MKGKIKRSAVEKRNLPALPVFEKSMCEYLKQMCVYEEEKEMIKTKIRIRKNVVFCSLLLFCFSTRILAGNKQNINVPLLFIEFVCVCVYAPNEREIFSVN